MHESAGSVSFKITEMASAALDKLLDELLGCVPELDIDDGLRIIDLDQQRHDLNKVGQQIQAVTIRLSTLEHSVLKARRALVNLEATRARILTLANNLIRKQKRKGKKKGKKKKVILPPEIISLICSFTEPGFHHIGSDVEDLACEGNLWGQLYEIRKPFFIDTLLGVSKYYVEDEATRAVFTKLQFLLNVDGYDGNLESVLEVATVEQLFGMSFPRPSWTNDHSSCAMLVERRKMPAGPIPHLRILHLHDGHVPCFLGSGLFENVTRLHFTINVETYRSSLPKALAEVPQIRILTIGLDHLSKLTPEELETNTDGDCDQVDVPFLYELQFCFDEFDHPRAWFIFLQSFPIRCSRIKKFQTHCLSYSKETQSTEHAYQQRESFLELVDLMNERFPKLEHLCFVARREIDLRLLEVQRQVLAHIATSSDVTGIPFFPSLNHIDISFDPSLDTLSILQYIAKSRYENASASRVTSLSLNGRCLGPHYEPPHATSKVTWVGALQPYFTNVTMYNSDISVNDLDTCKFFFKSLY